MYMFCCGSMSQRPGKEDQAENRPKQSPFAKSLNGCANPAITDAKKFDMAVANNDFHALVELLDSSHAISCHEQMHPWAENPRTVGALAAARLAMLAKDTRRERIGEAGAIPKLVALLKSDEVDRLHTAILALSFLTVDCPTNVCAACEAGAMPLLLKCIHTGGIGMRAASATTLRNICLEDPSQKKTFVEFGGLLGLVNQIGCSQDELANLADIQLEAVLNLHDMLEADDGSLVMEYVKIVVDAGVQKKLHTLLASDDVNLHTCVEEMLMNLSTVPSDSAASVAGESTSSVSSRGENVGTGESAR